MGISNIDDAAIRALRSDWGSATQDERMELLRNALMQHALQLELAGVALDALSVHGHLGNRVVIDIGG